LAEHFENLDHNSVYRYLKIEKPTPRLLWEKPKDQIIYSPAGAIIFDDTSNAHREAKQITGIEYCQCCLNRSQRNHIASALLVWTVYQRTG